jgi:hypothetical protein
MGSKEGHPDTTVVSEIPWGIENHLDRPGGNEPGIGEGRSVVPRNNDEFPAKRS